MIWDPVYLSRLIGCHGVAQVINLKFLNGEPSPSNVYKVSQSPPKCFLLLHYTQLYSVFLLYLFDWPFITSVQWTMDNSALPSVPWTEYLNGDFEDEYTALYPTFDHVNSRPGGDGQTGQPIDTLGSSAVAIRGWPTEECVSEGSVFPCDFNQALSASTGINRDGGVNPGKLLRSQVMFDIVL
jgi:hypothetical protein